MMRSRLSRPRAPFPRVFALLSLSGLLALGCSSDQDETILPPELPGESTGETQDESEQSPGALAPSSPSAPDEPNPAILIVGLVRGVDSGTLYVGAVPEVPTGDVSYAGFREFSALDGYA